ncbi:Glutamyl-tRNA(Gln) amidotransferase subunit B, mitochondrial [Hypsizygus marmoreus]|uniref:Glutamyl-tRNA(Gln) amidotransferase subunit B, mitochondrial n=1 Tax=Hypsizygus marmoreus TaxID=39966 RepID=A0A369JIG6_HYPMA|nr:Glutamyl-tRNA(Gln) amidotransferase subunit B, mitochondrial [Hypsizygus marmoreus]
MLRHLCQCRARSLQPRRLFHDVRVYKEDRRWPGWQVVVGIETHAQIKARRKLFSESLTSDPGEIPNTHVTLFDAAFPGTLPTLNQKCVDLALRAAVALECNIQARSSFDRKHYFYSDLPSGYQITQQYAPIALSGKLNISRPGSPTFPVRIKQIQLEQDTAKSTFNPRTRTSYIDLNRAGTGLMEIVSEPDLRSPEEAGAYVRTLQAVLRAVGSSDGNMEQGSLRCDVNVSVNRVGRPPGTRCEIKNLNSVRFMMAAIIHEISRQRTILESAPNPDTATVPQETRGFDEHRFETYRLRSKEDAPDYRYMPDPNLGVLVLNQDRILKIRETLPELPWDTRKRLSDEYGLSQRDVDVLLAVDSGREVKYDGEIGDADAGAVAYFDRLCAGRATPGSSSPERRDPKVVVNWMTHELLGQLAARKESFADNHLSVEQMGQLIDLVQNKTITGTSGKILLRQMLANPSRTPTEQVAQELQLIALSQRSSSPSSPSASASISTTTDDASSELRALCGDAIVALPDEVAAVRKGNKNVLNKIVGHVMKDSRGRADAKAVRALLEELILKQQ